MVNAIEDESRLAKMESDLHRHSGELTKLRVDFQSSSDVLRSDFEKKFTVFEAKQNHTDETCTKMLSLLEGRSTAAPAGNCLDLTPRGTHLAPAAAQAQHQYQMQGQRPFERPSYQQQAPQYQSTSPFQPQGWGSKGYGYIGWIQGQRDHDRPVLCLWEERSSSEGLQTAERRLSAS